MMRRCSSGECLVAATKKSRSFGLDLPVANVLHNPSRDWSAITTGHGRVASSRKISVDWNRFKIDDFLFTHCFVPNTMILMGDGTEKSIQHVCIGDEVITHLGRIRKVTAIMSKEVDEEMVEIKPASLPAMLVTKEHPFAIIRDECSRCKHSKWKKCVYGFSGRCTKLGCKTNGSEPHFVLAGDLKKGDKTFTPSLKTVVDSDFTAESMMLLGYYVAEGRIDHDNRPGEQDSVRFSISRDEIDTIGDDICRLMNLCFGVCSHGEFGNPNTGGCTFSFASNVAAKWFLYHAGCGSKSKRLSSEVMQSSPDVQKELLIGWSKGDGEFSIGRRLLRISTASSYLASQGEILIDRIGGLAIICKQKNSGGPKNRMKKGIIWHVSVKHSNMGTIRQQFPARNYSRWPRTGQRYRHAACVVSEITSLRTLPYKGLVYNFSVEEDESYVANRCAVHNCSIVSSVAVEDNGYYVVPPCDELVNSNGNAWSNPVLLACFKSFIGAENYYEHVQIPAMSKGKILDAVIRPVRYHGKNGGQADVYYVDILVATNRKHVDLIERIENGKLNTLSMGCFLDDTSVLMADGTRKSIQNVIIGESVRTHTGGVGYVESLRRRITEDGELRKLVIEGVPDSYVTAEHPYWYLKGFDVCAGCGQKLKHVVSPSIDQIMRRWCSSSCYQTHCNTNPRCTKTTATLCEQKVKFDWIEACKLVPGDYVAVPLGRPIKDRSRIDRSKARLLGYYAAEGNLQRCKKNGESHVYAAEFTFGFKEPSVYELVDLCRDLGIDNKKIYVQDRIRKKYKSTRVVVHDVDLAIWLLENCGEHCDGKYFAPYVLGLDDESLLNIIGAYINGDGHSRKKMTRICTTSCSRRLSEQVWTILLSLGIPAYMGHTTRKNRKDSWSVTTAVGYGRILVNYINKFMIEKKPVHSIQSFHGHMLRRVKANEVVRGCYFVNNLHVVNGDEDHSFMANDVAVHNCQAHILQCSKCGNESEDDNDECEHIKNDLGNYFVDKNGVKRIIAELCGKSYIDQQSGQRAGDPKSVEFIEASWVENPAFRGAVVNYLLNGPKEANVESAVYNSDKMSMLASIFEGDGRGLRVADTNGMLSLRIARSEIKRQKELEMINRVASWSRKISC